MRTGPAETSTGTLRAIDTTETEGDQTGDGYDPGDVLQPPTVEPMTFSSCDLTLEGDRYLPAASRPHSAIGLIHGSGPISRHAQLNGQLALQFGFAIPVFDELAQALGEAGWVVLTYDKRSCGTFNGCAENDYPLPDENLTTDAFASDARAGVAYVRTRGSRGPLGTASR